MFWRSKNTVCQGLFRNGGCKQLIIKGRNMGQKVNLCQITQELNRNFVTTGCIVVWIKMWGFGLIFVNMYDRGQERSTTMCVYLLALKYSGGSDIQIDEIVDCAWFLSIILYQRLKKSDL